MNSVLQKRLLPCLFSILLATGALGAAPPSDTVEVNSVWTSDTGHSLTIRERQGDKFRGLFVFQYGKATATVDVAGEIRGNKISWLAKDARVVKGNPGGDNFGTINGDRIDFTWRRSDNGLSGTFTLVRIPDQNSQPPAIAPVISKPGVTDTFEKTIEGCVWTWNNPKSQDWREGAEMQFSADGTLTQKNKAGRTAVFPWHVAGPRTILFGQDKGQRRVIFDESLSSFTAMELWNGNDTITGIRKSPAAASPPAVAITTPPVQIEQPNQPLLETLSVQAPNASAWVLAPLDAAVPPNIRQNLTYLREDLLDEVARNPKASANAYKTGGQLCDTMIAALDERDRALASAGFRAVEAQARTGVTSQALEARRNYQMSWPQFARENAQRAELKTQAINSAAVMAERPKLEWSQRTDQIRPVLDTLYKQFRAALRQGEPAK